MRIFLPGRPRAGCLMASTEAAKHRAGAHRQSVPGSDGESVSSHRRQKGEAKRSPSSGNAPAHPFRVLAPGFRKLSASLAASAGRSLLFAAEQGLRAPASDVGKALQGCDS